MRFDERLWARLSDCHSLTVLGATQASLRKFQTCLRKEQFIRAVAPNSQHLGTPHNGLGFWLVLLARFQLPCSTAAGKAAMWLARPLEGCMTPRKELGLRLVSHLLHGAYSRYRPNYFPQSMPAKVSTYISKYE